MNVAANAVRQSEWTKINNGTQPTNGKQGLTMTEIQNKAKKDSFYITLGTVGLGTVSLLAMTSELMENDIASIFFMITALLTMPVSFLGFGILWGGGENARMFMLLAQLGVFMIFWYLTFRYLSNRYRTREQRIKKTLGQTGTGRQQ